MKIPKIVKVAKSQIGTKEWPGPRSNPAVVKYFVSATGNELADSVPWCAAFVSWCLVKCDMKPLPSLLARSALRRGRKLSRPKIGCIGIWPRGKAWQGHTGIVSYVGKNTVKLVSGNQRNAVTERYYPISTAIGWRWPT